MYYSTSEAVEAIYNHEFVFVTPRTEKQCTNKHFRTHEALYPSEAEMLTGAGLRARIDGEDTAQGFFLKDNAVDAHGSNISLEVPDLTSGGALELVDALLQARVDLGSDDHVLRRQLEVWSNVEWEGEKCQLLVLRAHGEEIFYVLVAVRIVRGEVFANKRGSSLLQMLVDADIIAEEE